MAHKKVYDVSWTSSDGPDGYFVELSPNEVPEIEHALARHQADGKISDIRIQPIERPWVMTKLRFLNELRARTEG